MIYFDSRHSKNRKIKSVEMLMNIMLIITMFSQYQKFNKILVKLHVNNFGDRNARTLLSSLEFVDLLLCLLKGICYWENDACAHQKWRSIEVVNPKLRWPVFLNNVCFISSESSPSLIIITWYVLTLIITGILYLKKLCMNILSKKWELFISLPQYHNDKLCSRI